MEFKILKRMKEIRRVYNLYLRGTAFSLLREQVYRIIWEEASLKGKDAEEGCERHQLNTIIVHPDSQENKKVSQVAILTKQRAHSGIQMKKKKKGCVHEGLSGRGYEREI